MICWYHVPASSRLGDFGQLRGSINLLATRPQIFNPYDSHSGFNSRPEFGALDSGFLSIGYPSCVLGLRHPLWHRRSLSAWGSSAGLYRGLENRRVAQQRAPIDQSPDQRHDCHFSSQGISDSSDSCRDPTCRGRSCARLLESGAGTLKFSMVASVTSGWRSDPLRRESFWPASTKPRPGRCPAST